MIRLRSAILLTILCLASPKGIAQTWTSLGSGFPAADVAYGEEFGNAVSIDGNFALVGAPKNSSYALNQGKAVIFEKTGGQWVKRQELYYDNGMTDINFGAAVAITGDYAFISGPRFTYQGVFSGAVMVYKNISGTWTLQQRIDCPFPDDFVYFGTSVAASGNHLVVGAPGAYGSVAGAGAAFHFVLTAGSYVYQQRLTAASGVAGDKYGTAVAVNGSNIFVGSPSRLVSGQNAGVVYVYNITTHAEIAQLKMNTPVYGLMGSSLSLSSDVLVAGAPYTTNPNGSYGSVYLFIKPGGGWANGTEDHYLIPPTPTGYPLYGLAISLVDDYLLIGGASGTMVDLMKKGATGWTAPTLIKSFTEPGLIYNNQYGNAISMSSTDILIGAYNLYQPTLGSGVVFAYQKSGPEWDTPQSLNPLSAPSINASGDQFGNSVDIDGDLAVVGASQDDSYAVNSGAAYVFQFNGTTWQRVAKLTPAIGEANALFGSAVAITPDRIVVSAHEAARSGDTNGMVYVFEKPVGGWTDMHETTTIPRVAPTKPGKLGYDVEAIGNELIISHFKAGSTSSYGNVYVFEKSGANWPLKATLSPPTLNDDQADGFGASLDYDGTQLALGLGLANGRAGLLYVYEKPAGGWVSMNPTATLTPSDPVLFGGFGRGAAIFDRTIITKGTSKKAAYVFERAGTHWVNATENAKLSPSVVDAALQVRDVAIGRDNAVLSASLNGIGLVFLFTRTNQLWTNASSYDHWSGPNVSELGSSVGLNGDHLLATDPVANSASGGATGTVKLYLKQPTVLEVSSTSANGVYATGQPVNIYVKFSHAVTLVGNPTLELKMYDATTRNAVKDGNPVGGVVNFKYTVVANDSTPDLNYTDELAFKGSITITSSITGVQAIKTLPPILSPYSLGTLKNIALDGIFNPLPDPPVTAIADANGRFVVYPNPVKDKLTIEGDDVISYSFWTSTGSLASKGTGGSLDVSGFSPGLYLLELDTRSGPVVLKIIKQ